MEKETSCINSRAILDYVKEEKVEDYSSLVANLDPEIDALPDPESFLRDPNNWISCEVASKLYERARTMLGDEKAAYKIAKYAVENTSLGYAQRIFFKAFFSSKAALKHAQKINDKWNRNKRVDLVDIKRNEAVVRLHWDHQMKVTRDQCLMNQGTYTFLPLVWGGIPLKLMESCCYFEGAPYCEYHLKWSARNWFHEILSRFVTSGSVLKETMKEMDADKAVIEQKYEEVNRLNVELSRKVKQLTAIHETGKAILSVLDLEQLLNVIMNLLFNVCQINRAIIMLVNEEKGQLEYMHSVGFEGEIPDEIAHYCIPLDRVSNMLVRVANTGQSEYIPDVKTSKLRKENIMLTYGKPSSAYVVPLITRSKVIGVLATDAVDEEGVPEENRETLDIFASQIAIAIQNARLYSSLQEQMMALQRSHALLRRSEKFSFLGNLAARLAHEIKNPMTAISTFIQLLPTKYDDESFRKDFHKIATEETFRVNNLITELLDLVKKKESHFEFDDLHVLINKMILLISPQSKAKKIEMICKFDPDAGRVWLDSEKMKQVFLNLFSNAIDFTPEGGKVEIVTRKCVKGNNSDAVQIEIKDNGEGIEESVIHKIFDPYYTTKHKSDLHKGTGLGLFIAHQNMQDHAGSIEVKSKVNAGTKFILRLPSSPPSKLLIEAEETQKHANS
jgi:signal transduction histidine kinase